MTFQQLLKTTFKSADTEENIDIYFTRPCGLVLTLMYKALGFHPNIVTIIGILIGIVAAYFFYFEDLCSNLLGVLLLTIANFHDSADGQLARMTGKKSLIGRMLDGVSADVIFFFVYVAVWFRIANMYDYGFYWGFLLCLAAGVLGHSRQCAIADYYRQLHLLFLRGKDFAEFDTSESQQLVAEKAKAEKRWLDYAFFVNYSKYCRRQEGMTPWAQKFLAKWGDENGEWRTEEKRSEIREAFLNGSRPLMKWTNFLTYNWRAISLFTACLTNLPWLYPVIELTVFVAVRQHMHNSHERLCKRLVENEKGVS